MFAALSAFFIALAAAVAPPQLLWQQHEDAAVYTSAALARHVNLLPTFGTATWLNKPFTVETFNCSSNYDAPIWEYDYDNNVTGAIPTFSVIMARHAVDFGAASETVDTVAAGAFFVPPSACSFYGWSSTGDGTPVWEVDVPDCDSSLLYDMDRYLDISDDGSVAAFSAFTGSGDSSAPLLTVLNAQTGAKLFSATAPAGVGAGTVAVSDKGSYIMWQLSTGTIVYNAAGATVDTIAGLGHPKISESGSFITSCTENSATLYTYSATAGKYSLASTFTPPADGQTWFCMDSAVSTDGSGADDSELGAFGWVGNGALTARVTIYSLLSSTLLTDWTSATNAKLQTNPTVRMDGIYAGISLWGDADDTPTAVILAAGSSDVVFNYTTPGSMFGVDIVIDHGASTPTSKALYFAVAGKAVPANAFGNGGDAFTWRVEVAA